MPTYIVQSRPDAHGVRTFYGMDADPRRAPYSGRLKDEFLVKIGTNREWNVIATCYDVNADALMAAGATVLGHALGGFSTIPGDHSPEAWVMEDWMKEFIQS